MKPLVNKCCFVLDTTKGSALIGLASVFAFLAIYILIIFSFIYWDEFTERMIESFKKYADKELVVLILAVFWWGCLVTSNIAVLYIILCNILISSSLREKRRRYLPWLVVTFVILPIIFIFSLVLLAAGILGMEPFLLVLPGAIGVAWCLFWIYGVVVVFSSYQELTARLLQEEEDLEATVD